DPPGGVFMHWTRVLDVPLALLIKFFSFFLSGVEAERLTRIVFPLALHYGLFVAVISLARKLAGPSATLPAMMIAVLTGPIFAQFQPGRIHHHIAQILLVVLILRATLDAIETQSPRRAAWAAALAALSLSINIENIAYIVVEIAAFALVFAARGAAFRAALLGFAIALAGFSLLAFVATVGPSRYFLGVCDAFSTAHLFAIFVGAAALAAAAICAPVLRSAPLRLAAIGVGAALVVGATALAYPACLHDPQAAVDPLLREFWLSHVAEARPLIAMILADPTDLLIFALAAILGVAAALLAAWRERDNRTAWLVVSAFAAIGLLTSFWQIRAISSASALALFGGVWAAAKTMDWASAQKNIFAKLAPVAAILPFCSFFWAIVAAAAVKPKDDQGGEACRKPAAIQALGALPRSLIMAPIDMGSDILADTNHSVLAAPYHRNNHGNGALVRAMLANPGEARRIVEESGANYLIFCAALPEFRLYAQGNADGLAAALRRGDPPGWLAPVVIEPDSPFQVFKVQ
ncbi:MAG TPA: hypothetical protein VKS78_11275, partial [Roseiarcus sp.]|nr:hypothetical protein [Roseiarcus sp.]